MKDSLRAPLAAETPLRVHTREFRGSGGRGECFCMETRSIRRINNHCARVLSLKKRSYATVARRGAVGFLDLEQTIGGNRASLSFWDAIYVSASSAAPAISVFPAEFHGRWYRGKRNKARDRPSRSTQLEARGHAATAICPLAG